ncbi:hypothetical protein [Mesorhizobium amorphae]|uniref:hypothetical protein n=1 Tax=Mesorhizobium amorphae TaxID=71433 RepID=UPI00177C3B61|nr:hypothetical protein [Mesorhizobium amorphae]
MFASSAPYVVTILMSVITWVLSTYYEDISATPYLRYELKEDGRNASPPFVVYRFTNDSPKVRISDVTIGLDCPKSEECFGSPGAPAPTYAQMLKVPPWAMSDAIEPTSLIITQKIDLPPGMAFEIRAVLRSKEVKPFLYFQSNPDQKADLKLVGYSTLDQFVANNYLGIVTVSWVVACIVIIAAYQNAATTAANAASNPEKPQTIHLKIIES